MKILPEKRVLTAAILAVLLQGTLAQAQGFAGGKGGPPKGRPFVPGKQEGVQPVGGPPPGRPLQDRMSQEERQQLRRDIQQHGRDIYRNPQRP